MDEVISFVLGSAVSKETPRGSSLTNKAKTLNELQDFVTWLPESPKVTANTASNPPAPGTPASKTPSILIVASKSLVCDSGSICKFVKPKNQCKEKDVTFLKSNQNLR